MKSIRCSTILFTFTASAFLFVGNHASAALVVTNNFLPSSSLFSGINSDIGLAMSFTTGSTSSLWDFEGVILRLQGGPALAPLTVQLHADGGGIPGVTTSVLLGNSPLLGSPATDYIFIPMSSVTLAASTTYWISATSSSANINSYFWLETNPSNFIEIGLPGWSIQDGQALVFQGIWSPSSINPKIMGVFASAVPEPGSTSLVGLAALGLLRRRR